MKTSKGGKLTTAPDTETLAERMARQRAAREARDGTPEQTKAAEREFWATNNEMKKFWPRGK